MCEHSRSWTFHTELGPFWLFILFARFTRTRIQTQTYIQTFLLSFFLCRWSTYTLVSNVHLYAQARTKCTLFGNSIHIQLLMIFDLTIAMDIHALEMGQDQSNYCTLPRKTNFWIELFLQISDTGVRVCVCVWVGKIIFLRYKILFLGNVAPFNLIRPARFRQFFQRKLDFHRIIYGGDATFCLFTCRCQTNRGSLSLHQIDF